MYNQTVLLLSTKIPNSHNLAIFTILIKKSQLNRDVLNLNSGAD